MRGISSCRATSALSWTRSTLWRTTGACWWRGRSRPSLVGWRQRDSLARPPPPASENDGGPRRRRLARHPAAPGRPARLAALHQHPGPAWQVRRSRLAGRAPAPARRRRAAHPHPTPPPRYFRGLGGRLPVLVDDFKAEVGAMQEAGAPPPRRCSAAAALAPDDARASPPPARRPPQGGQLRAQLVHYPPLLRWWHRYRQLPPHGFSHKAAAAGESLQVHLAGVRDPAPEAVLQLLRLPRGQVHRLRVLDVVLAPRQEQGGPEGQGGRQGRRRGEVRAGAPARGRPACLLPRASVQPCDLQVPARLRRRGRSWRCRPASCCPASSRPARAWALQQRARAPRYRHSAQQQRPPPAQQQRRKLPGPPAPATPRSSPWSGSSSSRSPAAAPSRRRARASCGPCCGASCTRAAGRRQRAAAGGACPGGATFRSSCCERAWPGPRTLKTCTFPGPATGAWTGGRARRVLTACLAACCMRPAEAARCAPPTGRLTRSPRRYMRAAMEAAAQGRGVWAKEPVQQQSWAAWAAHNLRRLLPAQLAAAGPGGSLLPRPAPPPAGQLGPGGTGDPAGGSAQPAQPVQPVMLGLLARLRSRLPVGPGSKAAGGSAAEGAAAPTAGEPAPGTASALEAVQPQPMGRVSRAAQAVRSAVGGAAGRWLQRRRKGSA
jgi:hypothetical protein